MSAELLGGFDLAPAIAEAKRAVRDRAEYVQAWGQHAVPLGDTSEAIREALEAAATLIERAVREQVAREIEANRVRRCRPAFDRDEYETERAEGMDISASIARGKS